MAYNFKKTELAFEDKFDWYIPSQLVDIPIPALRKEYTRLRDIGEKSLKRLAESGYAGSEAYKYNVGKYPKLEDIRDLDTLTHKLSELSWFINQPSRTVRGQDEMLNKRIASLREKGYFVPTNKEEAINFFHFVDHVQNRHGQNVFYHFSEVQQMMAAFDDQVKELLSKGMFDEAYNYITDAIHERSYRKKMEKFKDWVRKNKHKEIKDLLQEEILAIYNNERVMTHIMNKDYKKAWNSMKQVRRKYKMNEEEIGGFTSF